MKKKFILDTCVLLHDADCLLNFEENDLIIPLIVLEELDRFKKGTDETARNSRHVARFLDELRHQGSLNEGVELPTGGTLTVSSDKYNAIGLLDPSVNDHQILATAQAHKGILVTQDINLRLKADSLGIPAESYGKESSLRELYSGIAEAIIEKETFLRFKKEGWAPFDSYGEYNLPNEYLVLINKENNARALARNDRAKKRLVKLVDLRDGIFGIRPKNDEQRFAIDALLNDNIKFVSLIGQAGTGKTLIAVAAGLEKMINDNQYSKLLISRPVQPMGKDIGYLPGDIEEKLNPWMQPIYDNLEFIFDLNKRHSPAKKKGKKKQQEGDNESLHKGKNYSHLMDSGLVSVEALTYIRGRSIPQQYMIIDEAQNLTPHEVKTIITRAGEGTKIVLTGDVEQIDSPYLDQKTNGLAYAVEKMKEELITAHVTLKEGERSELARIGSELL